MKNSSIKITNQRNGVTTIDVEGTIGVPETWQFDDPAGRVATYEKFSRTIARIAAIESAAIVVNIRSTGGDVGDALLIYDALESSGATVTTRCHGYVASAATIIAQAASPGCREIASSALYLIHNSVATCEGNAREMAGNVELLDKTDGRIASIYAARSGRSEEEFAALMAENNGNGRWLTPEEAIAAGLADVIVEAENTRGRKKKHPVANEAPTPGVNIDLSRQTLKSTQLRQTDVAATQTIPKEDPSPTESRRTANELAYMRDAENFQR